MKKIIESRLGFILFLILSFIAFSFITRTVFFIYSFDNISKSFFDVLKIYCGGFINDFITSVYYLIIPILVIIILPEKIYKQKYTRYLFLFFYSVYIFSMIFIMIAEFLFWQEFEVRFNFIAVDYLVYTHEVIGNIQESYNIPLILSVIFIISLIISFTFRKMIFMFTKKSYGLKKRFLFLTLYIVLFLFNVIYVDGSFLKNIDENNYNTELTFNGVYQFFKSYKNNSMDYDKYYLENSNRESITELRKILNKKNENFISKEDIYDFTRNFKTNFPENFEKKMNVILITVESLSGSFFSKYGQKKNLTPNLDEIMKKSLVFDNFFACGTRTVRGMEAIVLSIPPTPGRSIVKRPGNENLNSIGFVLKNNDYNTEFLYSGYGYFDNMNYFYKNNGFNIVDRSSISKDNISYANIWGVCDEDIYQKAILEADNSFKDNRPFFFQIMTTSNHRPYTYPDNKIDIPSKTGREGAVKYTDYALGQFVKNIKDKPWFDNTILVITADHCASSAGKVSLWPFKYHIPLLLYSPENIKSGEYQKMCSQIDLGPTLLDILGIQYKSKFFGQSVFSSDYRSRAFIGNYQKLGYMESNTLSIIEPVKQSEFYKVDFDTWKTVKIEKDKKLINKTILYYQSADYLYKNGYLLNNIESINKQNKKIYGAL